VYIIKRIELAMPVKPEDATTVILLRKSEIDKGFEVLMVLRHAKSQFVPDVYVFPGGRLDREDCDKDWVELCSGITLDSAHRRLDKSLSPERALGAWVAGIRETFEEAGILMALRGDGSLFYPRTDEETARFCRHRQDLINGKHSFRDMLRDESLALAADRLHYFSHWITPEPLPLRYDVRFFVAEAPPCQKALHDGIEVTEHVWKTPQAILEESRNGRFNMVFPTLMTIEALAQFETIAEVIDSTKNKNIDGILTELVEEDGRHVERLPGETGYKNPPQNNQ
jgi:8-oxo-dGTP pyrophosphatase MutT (NUDIX family)